MLQIKFWLIRGGRMSFILQDKSLRETSLALK